MGVGRITDVGKTAMDAAESPWATVVRTLVRKGYDAFSHRDTETARGDRRRRMPGITWPGATRCR
ncbi:hypothetical protein [Streptomyces sp. NPDC001153]